ncbi:MAG: hypothetical protein CL930_12500 [Deltaproteobacteria bacterium]|nr:hypothetical protein [Deltaproteobacteria bacterium]
MPMSLFNKSTMAMVLFCGLSGCMKTTVAVEPTPRKVDIKTADYVARAHFYFVGIHGHAIFDTKKLCPEGTEWMRDYRSFVDGLIYGITFSIYTPKTVLIKCSEGKPSAPTTSESPTPKAPAFELKNATPIDQESSQESDTLTPPATDTQSTIETPAGAATPAPETPAEAATPAPETPAEAATPSEESSAGGQ